MFFPVSSSSLFFGYLFDYHAYYCVSVSLFVAFCFCCCCCSDCLSFCLPASLSLSIAVSWKTYPVINMQKMNPLKTDKNTDNLRLTLSFGFSVPNWDRNQRKVCENYVLKRSEEKRIKEMIIKKSMPWLYKLYLLISISILNI